MFGLTGLLYGLLTLNYANVAEGWGKIEVIAPDEETAKEDRTMSADRPVTAAPYLAVAVGVLAMSWPVMAPGQKGGAGGGGQVSPAEKLERIIVPRVEMVSAPLADALEFLRIRSEGLDGDGGVGVRGSGLNFILKDPDGEIAEKAVTLTLNRVPLKTVLDYVTRFAGVGYRVDAHAVVIGRPEDLAGDAGMLFPGRVRADSQKIIDRLREMRLREVSVEDATVDEVISYFREVSAKPGGGAEGGLGRASALNFVYKDPGEPLPRITMRLRDVPLGTALRYACELGGVVYTVHPNVVAIGRADDLVPVPQDPGAHAYGRSGVRPGGAGLASKLAGLVVPRVELKSASLEEALSLVRAVALNSERAAGKENPDGINIVNLAQDNTQRISLSLADIPAWELMSYITGLTETEFRVERLAVVVDWKLPRRGVVVEKEGAPDLEGAGEEADVEPPRVLQVPVLERDHAGSIFPDARVAPLVVPEF